MDISITLAKQEVDVLQKLTDQSQYCYDLKNINLELSQFEGKHFSNLNLNQLLKRVVEISTKLNKLNLINSFEIPVHDISPASVLSFNLEDKISDLEQYKQKLQSYIQKNEILIKSKKGNYCRLEEGTKTFYFTLPNGSLQPITLYTERAQSDRTFQIFKLLYDNWLEVGNKAVSKEKMKVTLSKLGWREVSDNDIKNYVQNLRVTKIKPAKLSNYINIKYDKDEQGYQLEIHYP